MTESAHEGNSPITEQVSKKKNKIDINQIDTSALDTSVQESALKNNNSLHSGTGSGISKRTFNFSVTKDKPTNAKPNMAINLNQNSALSNVSAGQINMMQATQYKTNTGTD